MNEQRSMQMEEAQGGHLEMAAPVVDARKGQQGSEQRVDRNLKYA
jgi:hypothetical protein